MHSFTLMNTDNQRLGNMILDRLLSTYGNNNNQRFDMFEGVMTYEIDVTCTSEHFNKKHDVWKAFLQGYLFGITDAITY